MPNEQRALKVFLCHAHSDKDAVKALYSRLEAEGVDVWLDKEKLLPGADWEYEIRKAVRASDVVVVCLSKQFNKAGFRQKEVRLALDTAMEQPQGEIFIIPARLEECDNLESLDKWHWVDLFESDGFERLIMALRRRADRTGATLRLYRDGAGTGTTTQTTSDELGKKVKAEQEAAKNARIRAEEIARQKTAREIAGKAERQAAEKKSIIAVIGSVVLLSVLVTISAHRSALIGSAIRLMGQEIGWGIYLLPFGLSLMGVWLILSRHEKWPHLTFERATGSILFFCWLLAVFHLIAADLASADRAAIDGAGGGYIGSLLEKILLNSFGAGGTVVILLASLLITLAMIFDASVRDLFRWSYLLKRRE